MELCAVAIVLVTLVTPATMSLETVSAVAMITMARIVFRPVTVARMALLSAPTLMGDASVRETTTETMI